MVQGLPAGSQVGLFKNMRNNVADIMDGIDDTVAMVDEIDTALSHGLA
jgi:hypothetical protein